jgi:hypothetical protein
MICDRRNPAHVTHAQLCLACCSGRIKLANSGNQGQLAAIEEAMRLIVEWRPGIGTVLRDDVPVSFALYDRHSTRRFGHVEWSEVATQRREVRA